MKVPSMVPMVAAPTTEPGSWAAASWHSAMAAAERMQNVVNMTKPANQSPSSKSPFTQVLFLNCS